MHPHNAMHPLKPRGVHCIKIRVISHNRNKKRYVPQKPRFYRGFLLPKRRDLGMHIRRYKTPGDVAYKAKSEKYAKIISKTLIPDQGGFPSSASSRAISSLKRTTAERALPLFRTTASSPLRAASRPPVKRQKLSPKRWVAAR